jgi:hypothetical protein
VAGGSASKGVPAGDQGGGRVMPGGWVTSKYCAEAMRLAEREWDESPFAVTTRPAAVPGEVAGDSPGVAS